MGFELTPSNGGALPGSYSCPPPPPPHNTQMFHTRTCTCVHTFTHVPRTIDFSPFCVKQELNYLQTRTAVRWSHAQVEKSWKDLKKNTTLSPRFRQGESVEQQSQLQRDQQQLRLPPGSESPSEFPKEEKMRLWLNTVGRLHGCRNSGTFKLTSF